MAQAHHASRRRNDRVHAARAIERRAADRDDRARDQPEHDERSASTSRRARPPRDGCLSCRALECVDPRATRHDGVAGLPGAALGPTSRAAVTAHRRRHDAIAGSGPRARRVRRTRHGRCSACKREEPSRARSMRLRQLRRHTRGRARPAGPPRVGWWPWAPSSQRSRTMHVATRALLLMLFPPSRVLPQVTITSRGGHALANHLHHARRFAARSRRVDDAYNSATSQLLAIILRRRRSRGGVGVTTRRRPRFSRGFPVNVAAAVNPTSDNERRPPHAANLAVMRAESEKWACEWTGFANGF